MWIRPCCGSHRHDIQQLFGRKHKFLTNVLEIMDSAILRSEERAKLVVEFLLQDLLQDLGRPLAGLERLQEAVIRKLRDWDAETASRDRTLVLQNV